MSSRDPNIPGDVDILIPKSEDYSEDLIFEGSNFTGFTFECQIRKFPGIVAVLQIITVTPIDLTNGKIKLSLTNAQSSVLDFDNEVYYYRLYSISGTSIRNRIRKGRVRLSNH